MKREVENDSTYRGSTKNENFNFNSPIAPLVGEEDDYSRSWIYLSEPLKKNWKKNLQECNARYNLELPKPDDLTSYDNPDYLWLSKELNNLRYVCNEAVRDPRSGKLATGFSEIPYIQIRLQNLAFSPFTRYPKATINNYGFEYKPHYVIEFEYSFLSAFMNFIAEVFDDNPQEYIEVNGKKIITNQHKAPIYRMPPFDKYFDTRHDLPGLIFSRAIQMLLAHEMAHIARGHVDLKANNPDYGNNCDVILTEENDADIQGVSWVLGRRFLENKSNRLDITKDEYFLELSLTIFAVYLLYTWDYSMDKRLWSVETLTTDIKKSHLPYQLRAYNLIHISKNRLLNLGAISEKEGIFFLDDEKVSLGFMKRVYNESIDMIDSFERALHMFFAKTEKVCEVAMNTLELSQLIRKEMDSAPQLNKEQIPYKLGLEPEAQKELKRVYEMWNDVRRHLIRNGSYWKLNKHDSWIELNDKTVLNKFFNIELAN